MLRTRNDSTRPHGLPAIRHSFDTARSKRLVACLVRQARLSHYASAAMRFCIECNQLTDDAGRGVPLSGARRVTYYFVDAANARDAIVAFAGGIDHEVLGRIYHVGDIQALGTIRRGKSALALHAFPEEEAAWRRAGNGG